MSVKLNKKILIGAGPRNHVRLALDESEGLENEGFDSKIIVYGRNRDGIGFVNRLYGVIVNAVFLIFSLYRYSPDFLYLNSRFEPVGSARDFVSLFLVKAFYYKKINILIKSHGSDLSILTNNSLFYKYLVLPFLTSVVDKWFFLSQEEKDVITRHHEQLGEKVVVTVNIIDPSRSVSSAEFRRRYDIDENKFSFLFVGRMVRVKGIFSIIRSIPDLSFRDNCHFLFVGSGLDMKESERLVHELGVQDYVKFCGYITDEECDHFYANTDVLVYPTFDTEGFPMALFKSVSAGLPVITTQIRSSKDHLKSPDNTLWVDGESEASVGAAMAEIYNNQNLRARMTANNKALGRKFSQQLVCSEMSAEILSCS